ncbi:MAG TPA: hypothetical protein VL625_03790 [Patescibacteria group bacterium]|jgi:hypothetical protein|nr:hypothetical protein [Patescibacteria group bacterium]
MSPAHLLDHLYQYKLLILTALSVMFGSFIVLALFKIKTSSEPGVRHALKLNCFVALTIFCAIMIGILYCRTVIVSISQAEAVSAINRYVVSVGVNGAPVNYGHALVFDLRKMDTKPSRYHHSYPTKPAYKVVLHTEQGDVPLRLDPDSEVLDEYWVYYLKYKTTSDSDIGLVQTKAFKGPHAESAW